MGGAMVISPATISPVKVKLGPKMAWLIGAAFGSKTTVKAKPSPAGPMDTSLAARMVANGLRLALRDEVWQRRRLGACGQVGEARGLRLIVWMDG